MGNFKEFNKTKMISIIPTQSPDIANESIPEETPICSSMVTYPFASSKISIKDVDEDGEEVKQITLPKIAGNRSS